MLSSLASLLFLGTIQAAQDTSQAPRLPGIEIVSVAAPSSIKERLKPPQLSASGALLLDTESGEEIFSLEPDKKRPMASLTKIMTALLILERFGLQESVVVPPIADHIRGSSVGFQMGQRLPVASMLKALLLPSANDAAYALAVFHSHTVSAFVDAMNERAVSLGLRSTKFKDPTGLRSEDQYSTPRDLAWLTLAALKNDFFRSTVSQRTARIIASNGTEFDLRNTNEMLHYNEDVFGVKTGTTDEAGECLIILFREGDHTYLLVLLQSAERYTDSLNVLKAVQEASRL